MTTLLRPADKNDYEIVISWVPDLETARFWGGPAMIYPLSVDYLISVMHPSPETTFVLVDRVNHLIGFGQIQFRAPNRFHLARLMVNPAERGKGNGRRLVEHLMAQASIVPDRYCTLNVNRENQVAQNLYRSLGFQFAPHPIGSAFSESSLFMRKEW